MSYASDQTDKSLKELEAKISKEYTRAYAEMNKTANKYLSTLQDRYEKEYARYEAGDYTKEQFEAWYRTQVMRGERYKKMRDDLANRITEANKVAGAYINDKTPSIYSLNANYTAYEINKLTGADFTLVNEATVKELIATDKNFTEFRTVKTNPIRDYEWNKGQIQSALTSGILQGKSIDKLADSFMDVMKRNRSSAIRNARTAYTSAQNGGTLNSMQRAEDMGIKVQKVWKSMEDERVRLSHSMLDGQIRDLDQPFDNGLMHPSDSDGDPAEVYNCRCTLLHYLPKYESKKSVENYADKSKNEESYKQWIKRMEKAEDIPEDSNALYHLPRSIKSQTKYANKISKAIDDVFPAKSAWNGKIIRSKDCSALPTGSIALRSTASNKSIIHELIHMKSYRCDKDLYNDFALMEEASVDLLARELARRNHCFLAKEPVDVKFLTKLNKDFKLYSNDYDFAVDMINVELAKRGEWLKNKLINAGASDKILADVKYWLGV